MRNARRYTVVTERSRLGRWVTQSEAERVADLWRRHGLKNVRVIADERRPSRDGARRPSPRFDLGDRVAVIGTRIVGPVDHRTFDASVGQWFYKVADERGRSRVTWSQTSLRPAPRRGTTRRTS